MNGGRCQAYRQQLIGSRTRSQNLAPYRRQTWRRFADCLRIKRCEELRFHAR